MIIGCCGAGKSTMARAIHQKTGLPLIHLDQHYHLPGWKETPKSEWEAINHDLTKGQSWIIDGNFGGTMDIRMGRADTIIFMDYPTVRCFWRVIKRVLKYYGKVRPDMPKGCPERFDLEFLHYVATFGVVKRPGIIKKVEDFKGKKFIIRSDQQVSEFLEEI